MRHETIFITLFLLNSSLVSVLSVVEKLPNLMEKPFAPVATERSGLENFYALLLVSVLSVGRKLLLRVITYHR